MKDEDFSVMKFKLYGEERENEDGSSRIFGAGWSH